MLTRFVKLEFQADLIDQFLANFEENKERIRGFEGCLHLELLRERPNGNVFFTYSKWKSEDHLNAYRHSELFEQVWAKTKVLFAGKPEAWSVDSIQKLP